MSRSVRTLSTIATVLVFFSLIPAVLFGLLLAGTAGRVVGPVLIMVVPYALVCTALVVANQNAPPEARWPAVVAGLLLLAVLGFLLQMLVVLA